MSSLAMDTLSVPWASVVTTGKLATEMLLAKLKG